MFSSSIGSNIISFNAPRCTSLDDLLPQHFLHPISNSVRNVQRDQVQMRINTNIIVYPRIVFERPLPPWIGVSDGDELGTAVVMFSTDNGGNKAVSFDEDKAVTFDEIVCGCSTFIELSSSCRWAMASYFPRNCESIWFLSDGRLSAKH